MKRPKQRGVSLVSANTGNGCPMASALNLLEAAKSLERSDGRARVSQDVGSDPQSKPKLAATTLEMSLDVVKVEREQEFGRATAKETCEEIKHNGMLVADADRDV